MHVLSSPPSPTNRLTIPSGLHGQIGGDALNLELLAREALWTSKGSSRTQENIAARAVAKFPAGWKAKQTGVVPEAYGGRHVYTFTGPRGEVVEGRIPRTKQLAKIWAAAYPDAVERAEAMRTRQLLVSPRMRHMLIAFLTFTYGHKIDNPKDCASQFFNALNVGKAQPLLVRGFSWYLEVDVLLAHGGLKVGKLVLSKN